MTYIFFLGILVVRMEQSVENKGDVNVNIVAILKNTEQRVIFCAELLNTTLVVDRLVYCICLFKENGTKCPYRACNVMHRVSDTLHLRIFSYLDTPTKTYKLASSVDSFSHLREDIVLHIEPARLALSAIFDTLSGILNYYMRYLILCLRQLISYNQQLLRLSMNVGINGRCPIY